MRYREILEAQRAVDHAREAEKRLKAQKKLKDAQRKRSKAAQEYQAKLATSSETQRAAQAALRT